MEKPILSASVCALFLATADAFGASIPPASPAAMATEVRALVASGAGALMPDLDAAYIQDGGLVPLGEGDFPAMFLHGLVAEWRDGVAVFPVEVRLDDATGDAYFLDALGEPFWYIPSDVPERYRPWLVANPSTTQAAPPSPTSPSTSSPTNPSPASSTAATATRPYPPASSASESIWV